MRQGTSLNVKWVPVILIFLANKMNYFQNDRSYVTPYAFEFKIINISSLELDLKLLIVLFYNLYY